MEIKLILCYSITLQAVYLGGECTHAQAETRETRIRGHLRVSYVLIDGPRKDPIKRETARSPCYSKNYHCGNITSKVKTYVL